MPVIIHQAVREDKKPGLHGVMNKLRKEEMSVLIVEEDISSMVTALGNVVEKFGHYDPSSSWHAATIDDRDGKFRATAGTVGKKG